MRKFLFLLMVTCVVFSTLAQEEFNAVVTVNADKVQSSNKQLYKTLESQLTEFINQTKWSSKKFLPQERINCAFTIIVNSQDTNNFKATLQVQSTRPVYGTSYESPILNINDTKFSFQYNEFDPLIYNPNSFNGNLISTIVFYVYAVLGVDADTFKLNGGQAYFKKAENIVLQAQQSGGGAWQSQIGEQNRFMLIDNLVSPKFSALHRIYYKYHRKGFDRLHIAEKEAKKEIINTVLNLKKLHNITVGNYMIRIFLDAKSDEIVNLFSDGKTTGEELKLKEVLQKIAPTQQNKWAKIKS